jgi:hypothetical protein
MILLLEILLAISIGVNIKLVMVAFRLYNENEQFRNN